MRPATIAVPADFNPRGTRTLTPKTTTTWHIGAASKAPPTLPQASISEARSTVTGLRPPNARAARAAQTTTMMVSPGRRGRPKTSSPATAAKPPPTSPTRAQLSSLYLCARASVMSVRAHSRRDCSSLSIAQEFGGTTLKRLAEDRYENRLPTPYPRNTRCMGRGGESDSLWRLATLRSIDFLRESLWWCRDWLVIVANRYEIRWWGSLLYCNCCVGFS